MTFRRTVWIDLYGAESRTIGCSATIDRALLSVAGIGLGYRRLMWRRRNVKVEVEMEN